MQCHTYTWSSTLMFTVCPFAGKYSALSVGHVPVKAACSCLTSLLLLVDALPTKRKALQQCYTLQKAADNTIKAADNTIKAKVAYFKTHEVLSFSSIQLLLPGTICKPICSSCHMVPHGAAYIALLSPG